MNSNARLLSYSAVIAGMGLGISPLIASTLMFYPAVLPKALLASTAVFGGCSIFAYMKPKSSLLYLQGPLSGAIFALIAL
ncbi:MAG: Bax inhibitor-1 family protein [bacterium]